MHIRNTAAHEDTRILRWKPNAGESHQCVVSVFILYYNGKHLTILYHRKLIPIHRHPPIEGYNLLLFSNTHWKGAPTPWSRLTVPTRREFQPPWSDLPATTRKKLRLPHWRLQPSTPLWTTFHNVSYKIHLTQQHQTCRPPLIIFSDWTHFHHLSPISNNNFETNHYIKSLNH